MAVDASHITLLPPPNMDMTYQGNYDDQLPAFGVKSEIVLPVCDFRTTDAFPATVSRKRSRDSSSFNPVPFSVQNVNRGEHRFDDVTFLGGDISSHIYQQQQVEVDRLIAHHMENVRLEMEQMRKRNTCRLIEAVHETITKRLQQKEEQYLKIGRLNWSLEEKVKSLSIENQILKELVQTNEATANALRNKLQLVLAQIQLQPQRLQHGTNAVKVDDAESYCSGSNNDEDNRQVAEGEGEGEGGGKDRKVIDNNDGMASSSSRYGTGRMDRRCRKCEKEESCVLLLPCRHLCVCRLCVSFISVCPVCNATKAAGVVVNMTSS